MSYNDSPFQRNSSGVIINTNVNRQITEGKREKEKEKSLSDALSSIQKNQKVLQEQVRELKALFDILLERL